MPKIVATTFAAAKPPAQRRSDQKWGSETRITLGGENVGTKKGVIFSSDPSPLFNNHLTIFSIIFNNLSIILD